MTTGETFPAELLQVGDTYWCEDRVARVANVEEGLRFVLVEHEDGTAASYRRTEPVVVVDLAAGGEHQGLVDDINYCVRLTD